MRVERPAVRDFQAEVPRPTRRTENAVAQGKRADPAADARFVQDFERRLPLPAAAKQERLAFMAQSPLNFFRATPALFHANAGQAHLLPRNPPTLTVVGDAHLGNFGSVRGPDGKPVFSVNDFDHAGKGTPEEDLQRLATSAVLLARERGWPPARQEGLVKQLAETYFATVAAQAKGKPDEAFLKKSEVRGDLEVLLDRAGKQSREELLEKNVHGSQFIYDDKLQPADPKLTRQVEAAMKEYGAQLPKDAPIKVPVKILDVADATHRGGNSRGLGRAWVLVEGADGKKPRILQLKQLMPSALDTLEPDLSKADARKLVDRQESLGALHNPLTGAAKVNGQRWLVTEREPEKRDLDLAGVNAMDLATGAAKVLARTHGSTKESADAIQQWVGNDAAQAVKALTKQSIALADEMEAAQALVAKTTSASGKS